MKTPFTIGITGGSGSGKTYFIKLLSERFPADLICLVSQDHYYKSREFQWKDENGIINFDLPTGIDEEALLRDLKLLKSGQSVQVKEYTFNNPSATPSILHFKPAPVIIVEGLFVQYFPGIEKELDLKIFVEARNHVKLTRRIRRDNEERGYPLDDVLYRYENHVMPIYERLIKPLKHQADLVIPNNQNFDRALDFLSRALGTYLQ